MNARRGMLRLWIVLGTLFAVGIIAASYNPIRGEFRDAAIDYDALAKQAGGEAMLPLACRQARGIATTDYSVNQGYCWYETSKFRKLYPEYDDLSDRELSLGLYAKVGIQLTRPRPWTKLAATVGFALGMPLVVLALGWSLSWAISGFRSSSGQPPPET